MYISFLHLMLISLPTQIIARTPNKYTYSRSKKNLPFNATTCLNSRVPSLSLCASLAGGSQTVTFFYNKDDSQCQWACIFLYTENCSTLCTSPWTSYELEYERNAALNTVPKASSVLSDAPALWSPNFAVDGIYQMTGTEIFHSALEDSPWFMITLEEPSTISFIRVYNRDETRFHDVAVEVNCESMCDYIQRGFFKGPGKARQVVEIMCDPNTIAKVVMLRIIHGTGNYLNFAELELYIK